MTDFNALLRKSIATVQEGYQSAVKDLSEVVNEIGVAISDLSSGACDLQLQTIAVDVAGTSFRIYLDTNSKDPSALSVPIIDLFLTNKGYPINAGQIDKATGRFFTQTYFSDRADLERFFADTLGNPDSSLIQSLGFAMRKNESRST